MLFMRSIKYDICNSEQSNQKFFFVFRQQGATLFIQSTKIHKNKSEKSKNKDP